MKKSGCYSLMFAIAFLFVSSVATAEEAVIISLSGKAELIQAGVVQPAAAGKRLKNGDSLRVTSGEATLVTSGGKLTIVSPGSTYTLSAAREQEKKGLTDRLMTSLAETTADYDGPTVKGMVRGEDTLQPVYPHNTVIFVEDLHFSWKSDRELEGMKFELKKRNPKFAFSKALPEGSTDFTYPIDAPPVEENVSYYWKIEGYDVLTGEPAETSLAWFQIISEDMAGEVKKEAAEVKEIAGVDDDVRVILLVGLYSSHQLYASALHELERALLKKPEDKTLQGLKVNVERKMGLVD